MYVNTVYLEKALQINPFCGLYITVKFFFVCFKLRILFKMNFHLYCGRFPPLLKTQADTVPLQRPYGKQYESHCFVIVIAISAQKAPQHHTSSVWRAFTVAHPFSHLNHTLFTPSVLRGLDSCPVSSRHRAVRDFCASGMGGGVYVWEGGHSQNESRRIPFGSRMGGGDAPEEEAGIADGVERHRLFHPQSLSLITFFSFPHKCARRHIRKHAAQEGDEVLTGGGERL